MSSACTMEIHIWYKIYTSQATWKFQKLLLKLIPRVADIGEIIDSMITLLINLRGQSQSHIRGEFTPSEVLVTKPQGYKQMHSFKFTLGVAIGKLGFSGWSRRITSSRSTSLGSVAEHSYLNMKVGIPSFFFFFYLVDLKKYQSKVVKDSHRSEASGHRNQGLMGDFV